MTENYDSDNALSTENPDCALVPVVNRKPVVVLLTTSATKGRSIRHWIPAAVTDLEGGVLFVPTVTTVDEAYERLEELVHSKGTVEPLRSLVHLEIEPNAFVITYDMTAEDEVSIPLVWRGHPVRVVTMDSPVRADARAVLCRYRGRMSKELRVYRGDLGEEGLE